MFYPEFEGTFLSLPGALSLPVLGELVTRGFQYGDNLVVEFQSDSLWFETSLTIAAHALRNGIKTDYHVLQHSPNEIKRSLSGFGLNVEKLEAEGNFRIIDTYSLTVGLGSPEQPKVGRPPYQTQSVKVSDWSILIAQQLKSAPLESEKRRLHIDDNTSVLNRYNKENEVADFWRTRISPSVRAREILLMNSLVAGVYPDPFYKQFESTCDGIIDFKSEQKGEGIEHFVRVRMMRGRNFDSRWRGLKLSDNGEVSLVG
jgi:KaiC/GvpD/RAD55 family RecA-like ATPase